MNIAKGASLCQLEIFPQWPYIRTVAYFTDAPLKTCTEIVYAFRARRDKPERWHNNQPTKMCTLHSRASYLNITHRALAVYTTSLIYNVSVPVAWRQGWWGIKASPPREGGWKYGYKSRSAPNTNNGVYSLYRRSSLKCRRNPWWCWWR